MSTKSAGVPPATLATMRAFNDLVNRIRRLEFTKHMFTQKTGVDIQWGEGKAEPVATLRGPTETQVDAMFLVLRIVLQPQDSVGLDKMVALVKTLPDSQDKEWFVDAAAKINAYLDRKTNPGIVYQGVDPVTKKVRINEDVSNRRLIELVLYGERAHLNADKVPIVQGLRSWKAGSAIVDNTLHAAVGDFFRGLFYLRGEIVRIYEALTGEKLFVEPPAPAAAPET